MAYAIDPTGKARKARTLTAADPITGATFTRKTARAYVACLVTGEGGKAWPGSWYGRPELAQAALAKARANGCSDARLAPVVSDPWATPEPEAQAAPAPTPRTPQEAQAAQGLAALQEARILRKARAVLPGEALPPEPPAWGEPAPELPAMPQIKRAEWMLAPWAGQPLPPMKAWPLYPQGAQ